jgi:hypothetical protein
MAIKKSSFPASLGPDLKEPGASAPPDAFYSRPGSWVLGGQLHPGIRYRSDVNKRPGQIKVTIETGFCSFCDRTRNLRREERQLGALIRTVTACESCHRVLSSTIGVAETEAASTEVTVPAAATPAEIAKVSKPAPIKPAATSKTKTAPAGRRDASSPKAAGAKTKAPANRRTK